MQKILNDVTHKICSPCEKNCSDKLDYTLKFKRNKTTFTLLVFSFITHLIFCFTTNSTFCLEFLESIKCLTIITIIFLILCRSHERALRIILLIAHIIGPFHHIVLKDNLTLVPLNFMFLGLLGYLMLTNEPKNFLFLIIYQIAIFWFCGKNKLMNNLEKLGTDGFLDWVNLLIIYLQVTILLSVLAIYVVLPKRANIIRDYKHRVEEHEKIKNFLLSFSGEMRNYLNSILGSIELALSDSNPPITQYLTKAKNCSEILLKELVNIIDSGKELLGELDIQKKSVPTSHFINSIWVLCSELIKSKNMRGFLLISPSMPNNLILDPARISQIVINLVSNAVKFKRKGTVIVKVDWIEVDDGKKSKDPKSSLFDSEESVLDKEINFMLTRNSHLLFEVDHVINNSIKAHHQQINPHGSLKISVIDNGMGISEEEKGNIFRRGFNKTQDGKKYSKLTLGLYMSKKLAKLMQGDLIFSSQENQGSCFELTVPVAIDRIFSKNEADFSLTDTDELAHRRVSNIMIVDDDDFNVKIIDSYFAKIGISARKFASNGEIAVSEFIKSHKEGDQINFITMDIDMPLMNGKKAAEEIRRYEKSNNLKLSVILMISGNYTQGEVDECLKEDGKIRANGFLSKPVNFRVFQNLIEKFVKK